MEIDLTGFIIFIFAIFPGFFANELFKIFIGADWKEDRWIEIIRSISFSFFGLCLYIFLGNKLLQLPFPLYLLSSTYKENFLSYPHNIELILVSLLMNIFSAIIIGGVYVFFVWLFNKYSRITTYPNTWTQFCRQYIPNRWTCVYLQNGDIYRGRIKIINDVSGDADRDLVLEDPSLYSIENNEYYPSHNKYIFFPSKDIKFIAAMNNAKEINVNVEEKKNE